ncbi:hypothetical protein niasHT_030381 [Heterodera trifolii]|uniref:ISXO2-like transposase domain-containing protein n=1 Tax=Heterodera trifolii TaxID=157864 RepID=A0ABD2K8M5_9BILA
MTKKKVKVEKLELAPNRARPTELDESKFGKRIIQQHIAVGTEIHTDCWRAYARLTEFGYLHKVVNHSDPFIGICGWHAYTTYRGELEPREGLVS